jgi:hypothetical protein
MLSVNRESRHETLRHYHLIYPVDSMNSLIRKHHARQTCRERPFFFNPETDSVFIELAEGADFTLGDWIGYLERKYPQLLERVTTLEIRNIDFRWPSGQLVWENSFASRYYHSDHTILPSFPSLKTLCFTARKAPENDVTLAAAPDSTKYKEFQEEANNWYKQRVANIGKIEGVGHRSHKKESTTIVGKISTPQIICRPWAKIADGPFDPYADEEEL